MQSISKEDLIDMLRFIETRTELTINRASQIKEYRQFLSSPEGMDLFDATCMRLQTIGEATKNVDNLTNGNLFSKYSSIPWKSVIGLRNIISHEYLAIDPQEIYAIVIKHLPFLLSTIRVVITDLEKEYHSN